MQFFLRPSLSLIILILFSASYSFATSSSKIPVEDEQLRSTTYNGKTIWCSNARSADSPEPGKVKNTSQGKVFVPDEKNQKKRLRRLRTKLKKARSKKQKKKVRRRLKAYKNKIAELDDACKDAFVNKNWVEFITSAVNDYGKDVAIAPDGSIYMTGYVSSSILGATWSGGSDAMLAKFNAGGEMLWARLLGTEQNEYGLGVAADADGVYITGSTWGAFEGFTNPGWSDVFVAGYDHSGNLSWLKQFGTTMKYEQGSDIAVDNSGYVYVAGHASRAVSDSSSEEGLDHFVAKYRSDGTAVWKKHMGVNASASGTPDIGIAVSSGGTICLVGKAGDEFVPSEARGQFDAYIATLNGVSSAISWKHLIGTPQSESFYGAAIDPTSQYCYAVGYVESDFIEQPFPVTAGKGGADIMLAKYYMPSGKHEWTKVLGGPDHDFGSGVAVDPSGNIYISGYTQGSFEEQAAFGDRDIVLAVLNSQGTVISVTQYGTSLWDEAEDIRVDANANTYVVGWTENTLNSETNLGGAIGFGAYEAFLWRKESSS